MKLLQAARTSRSRAAVSSRAVLPLLIGEAAEPVPIDPVEEVKEVPAGLGNQGRRDLGRGRRPVPMLHRDIWR